MRWLEKYIPETDDSEDIIEVYCLEHESEALIKYAGWIEYEPELLADGVIDSMFTSNHDEPEKELEKFCKDMYGYAEEWCKSVRVLAQDTEYAQGRLFYQEVADEVKRKLEQNDLIEHVWQPVRKGE